MGDLIDLSTVRAENSRNEERPVLAAFYHRSETEYRALPAFDGFDNYELGQGWMVAAVSKDLFKRLLRKHEKDVPEGMDELEYFRGKRPVTIGRIETSPALKDRGMFLDDDEEELSFVKFRSFLFAPSGTGFLLTYFGWGSMNSAGDQGCWSRQVEHDGLDIRVLQGGTWCRLGVPPEDEYWLEDSTDMVLSIIMGDGVCGCGSPEGAIEALQNHLSVYMGSLIYNDAETDENRERVWSPKCSDLVDGQQYVFAYLFDMRGFLEHGSGVRHSWLSPSGKLLQLFLKHHYQDGEV